MIRTRHILFDSEISVPSVLSHIIPSNPNQICGITPSDIDKYSRVLFPVSFVCFNMLYWIIYLHISNISYPDLVMLDPKVE